MIFILLRKKETDFKIIKSLNKYPNFKAQTRDEYQQVETYENSTILFDDMLLSKQASNIDFFFHKRATQ